MSLNIAVKFIHYQKLDSFNYIIVLQTVWVYLYQFVGFNS